MKQLNELSFSEYYNSKQKLLESAEECPRIYSYYSMINYRKMPLLEDYDNNEKIYISFKPKDKIKILWEYENIYFPTAKKFIVFRDDNITENYVPCWSNKKLLKWVMNNAIEIDHNSAS